MKRYNKGFTLIEVALFLVITGALFLAVTVGVQNSITQQKYNDSVQSFVEFLRGVYAGVLNVENDANQGAGRSDKAIYGKLVSFGESAGNEDEYSATKVYVYDVIGNTLPSASEVTDNSVLSLLSNYNLSVYVQDNEGGIKPVGLIEDYVPRWSTRIENTENYEIFKGAILIIRHPVTGTVYTFVKDGAIDVRQSIDDVASRMDAINAQLSNPNLSEEEKTSLAKEKQDIKDSGVNYSIVSQYFKVKEGGKPEEAFHIGTIDLCVDPMGNKSTIRRDVRINEGARNSSGIEIMPDNNPCNKEEN